MDPKLVDEAKKRPGRCLASGDTVGPFIDTGKWAREHDPYVYLSVRWIEDIARKQLDMLSREDFDYHFKELEELVAAQGVKLAALERFEEAAAEYEEARQAVTETAGEVMVS